MIRLIITLSLTILLAACSTLSSIVDPVVELLDPARHRRFVGFTPDRRHRRRDIASEIFGLELAALSSGKTLSPPARGAHTVDVGDRLARPFEPVEEPGLLPGADATVGDLLERAHGRQSTGRPLWSSGRGIAVQLNFVTGEARRSPSMVRSTFSL